LYQRTHYLLPHDDQLDGRAVAFMYYLTSLNQDEGGALCLYDSKDNTPTRIQQKIQPQKNTFVFFRVSAKSFHEIKEVLRGNRLTLTGWFYYA
jgi:prolyl 3-hydroxylase /prolyl 3,4-dihydroxylase